MPGNDKSVQKDRFVVLKNKQKNRLTVSIRKIAFSEIKEVDEMTKEKSSKIMYRKVGDYKIPNIILPPEQANITIGKWGERVPVAFKQANRPSRQARHDA